MTSQEIVLLVGAILISFVIGSFTNVIIDRLPLRLDEPNKFGEEYDVRPWPEVLGGRSRCSSCGEPVRPIDNIPVVSWLVLRGKCRGCGDRIPAFHLLVELVVPALTATAIAVVGVNAQLPMALWLIPVAVAVAFIDHRTLIVPTKLIWPAFGVSVVVAIIVALIEGHADWLWGGAVGIGVLAGPLFLIWLVHPRGMGFGDVRLTVLLGWHVGFAALVAGGRLTTAVFLAVCCMAIASVAGIIYALASGLAGKHVPFGPTLSAAALATVFLASRIVAPL